VEGAGLLPHFIQSAVAQVLASPLVFNLVVSNVPGPPIPLHLMGRRVTAVHPAVPVPDGHGITVGALSYAGRVGIGVTADATAAPDVVEIARDLESALDALRVTPPSRSGTRRSASPS
jgi:hypothetical protein